MCGRLFGKPSPELQILETRKTWQTTSVKSRCDRICRRYETLLNQTDLAHSLAFKPNGIAWCVFTQPNSSPFSTPVICHSPQCPAHSLFPSLMLSLNLAQIPVGKPQLSWAESMAEILLTIKQCGWLLNNALVHRIIAQVLFSLLWHVRL